MKVESIDKHIINFGPNDQHFLWEQKEKSAINLRNITVYL